MKSVHTHYDPLSQVFHWSTALLVVVAFILGPEHFGRLMRQGMDPATRSGIVWHETLGIAVASLTLLRLLWVAARPQTPTFAMAGWMHTLSRITQASLWVLLLATPLSAILALGTEGHPLTLVAGIRMDEMPVLAKSSLLKAMDWGEVHETLGDLILWLSGLHAAGALWHHHVLKDGILKTMLPGKP